MPGYKVKEDLELHVSPENEQESAAELLLTPSPTEEQQASMDLTLEADSIFKAEEITFDGEAESEFRIEEAMKAYDAAMDDAAGMKQENYYG